MNQYGVRERIDELKEANSRKATLTREKTIEFLCNVINASAAKVDVDSPLVQSAEFVHGKPCEDPYPRQDRGGQGTGAGMRLGEAGPG